jgi:hypothetical protein
MHCGCAYNLLKAQAPVLLPTSPVLLLPQGPGAAQQQKEGDEEERQKKKGRKRIQ